MLLVRRAVAVACFAVAAVAAADPAFIPVTRDVDVIRYEIEMTVSALSDAPVDATVTIEAKALRDIRSIRLNVEPQRIAVDHVRIAGGEDLAFAIESGEANAYGLTGSTLLINLGRTVGSGTTTRIEIGYRITVARELRGLFFTPNFQGAALLTTRSWPYFARLWLPSNDHPTDGAEFKFTLTAPANAIAVANGELISMTSVGDAVQWVWEQTTPIPTYSAQITIGDLRGEQSTLCFDRDTGIRGDCRDASPQIPLLFVHPVNVVGKEFFETQIDKAASAIAYFSKTLGPYRFAKAGFAIVPHPFNMESASIVTLINPGAAVHETVHHWWGNSVRIGSWGDFWISEGLTTYFTGFYDEVTTGTNTACMVTTRKLDVASDQDPLDIFNTDPYCIGSAAVHDARLILARLMSKKVNDPAAVSAFLEVFSSVYEELASRSVTTRALRRALTAAMFDELQSAGSSVTFAAVDAEMQNWERAWFANVTEEPQARRRIVAK